MNAPSLLLGAPPCCDDETWELIPDWPHESSTCGRVRSVDRLGEDGIWRLGGLLPPQPDNRPGKGYLYYDLRDGSRRRRIPAAVAVLEAHRGLRPAGCEACHNHGIRTDNHLKRIRWDTRAANLADMAEHAALRAMTERVAMTDDLSQARGHRGVRDLGICHGLSVTRQEAQGTGSLPPFSSFPSVFPSVQPCSSTLRTLFRSLRNRQAA